MRFFAIAGLMLFAWSPYVFASDDSNVTEKKAKPASDPAKGLNFYSIEKEIALGRQMAEQVEKESHLLEDLAITEYVNRLSQNLVRSSDTRVPFSIKVIDSSEINAFALPGGFMFVNAGLISVTECEAELAGVLAHEIGHVAARHATKQATRGTILDYATIPLVFMGGWAVVVREAASLAVPIGFLHFSRAMEAQADRLGLEYMYRAGYDPNAFIDFFERIETLEKKKPGTVSKIFSTHPATGARIRGAQKVIQTELASRSESVLDTSEFHRMQDRIAAVGHTAGSDQKPRLLRRTKDNSTEHEPSESQDNQTPTLKRRR